MTAPPEVIVIGAASLDIKGRAYGEVVPLTSNPGEIHFSCGGEARNIAENLARLGVHTMLLSAVGGDSFGEKILQETQAAGVNIAPVLRSAEYASATYLAVLDAFGNLAFSIDDMRILDLIRPWYVFRHRRWFKEAKMVVMDTNLTPRTIESVLKIAERYGVPVALNAVSVSLAPRAKAFLSRLTLLAANIHETQAIVGQAIRDDWDALAAAQELVSAGVRIAIVTLAENGLCYATSQESGYIAAIPCDVVDDTGAGAASMAAILYGLVNDMPVGEAMRLGVSAATLTLKSVETVRKDLSLDLLYDQLIV